MNTDRELTQTELRAAEGVTLAEMELVMLGALRHDLMAHANRALAYAEGQILHDNWPEAMAIASEAIDLAGKVKAMLDDMRPLIDDAAGREQLAERDRTESTSH